ncbi:hypothetical protein A5880_001501 [Enterococcus sp. 4G2_DIV0659]|uniref:Uncharacterized protein n=1 Tax=Candidatus Enterococcus mansonii TaxID=1834181 RepID=A0A242CF66_9ENTE|nr:hypothetical protein A5880_001422 [Enterococcus sp. 4G2_DIV0659]
MTKCIEDNSGNTFYNVKMEGIIELEIPKELKKFF